MVHRIYRALASSTLAVALLVLLALVTLFGTLAQAEVGLYVAQQQYFQSLWVVHHLFGVVPLPLPGGGLLMILLFVNLFLGGLIRARFSLRQPGMMIAHVGVLYLFVAAFVTYFLAFEGTLTLYEGERGSTAYSYHDWEIEIEEVGVSLENLHAIPHDSLRKAGRDGVRVFHADDLPFDIAVSNMYVNSKPLPAGDDQPSGSVAIDGYYLQELPRSQAGSQNVPGCLVTVGGSDDGTAGKQAILWGHARQPWTYTDGDRTWLIALQRKRWELPFTIQLNTFQHELHPGTSIPRLFCSEVTKIEGGTKEAVEISMNRPLRHQGVTLFQSSWGPQGARPGARLFSTFAVVSNPSDQWPLYSCLVVCFGMTLHFLQRLIKFLAQREQV
jgi:hypothetical protein